MKKEQLIKHIAVFSSLLTDVLLTLGRWSSELRSRGANEILRDYFEPCLELLQKEEGVPTQVRSGASEEAHLTVARFCDGQYQRLRGHMESAEFKDSLRIRRSLADDVQQM